MKCTWWWQNNQFSWNWTEIKRNVSISLIILRRAEGEASLPNAGSQFWCERAKILHCFQNQWTQFRCFVVAERPNSRTLKTNDNSVQNQVKHASSKMPEAISPQLCSICAGSPRFVSRSSDPSYIPASSTMLQHAGSSEQDIPWCGALWPAVTWVKRELKE